MTTLLGKQRLRKTNSWKEDQNYKYETFSWAKEETWELNGFKEMNDSYDLIKFLIWLPLDLVQLKS